MRTGTKAVAVLSAALLVGAGNIAAHADVVINTLENDLGSTTMMLSAGGPIGTTHLRLQVEGKNEDGVGGCNLESGETLTVQIESVAAVEHVEEILAVDGVDAIFVGPSDLAASMGFLGQQEHPDVVAAVEHCIRAAAAAGKPAGVNAFAPAVADRYLDAGAAFVLVGADVAMLARASEALADRFIARRGDGADGGAAGPATAPRASY